VVNYPALTDWVSGEKEEQGLAGPLLRWTGEGELGRRRP